MEASIARTERNPVVAVLDAWRRLSGQSTRACIRTAPSIAGRRWTWHWENCWIWPATRAGRFQRRWMRSNRSCLIGGQHISRIPIRRKIEAPVSEALSRKRRVHIRRPDVFGEPDSALQLASPVRTLFSQTIFTRLQSPPKGDALSDSFPALAIVVYTHVVILKSVAFSGDGNRSQFSSMPLLGEALPGSHWRLVPDKGIGKDTGGPAIACRPEARAGFG